MAVRIRLTRVGATKRPAYRVIAIDKRRPRDGRALDILGFYDPLTDPATVQIDAAKLESWLQKGAQPSDTVVKLMHQAGLAGDRPAPPRAAPARKTSKKAAAKAQAGTEAPGAAAPEPEAQSAVAEAAPESEAAETPVTEGGAAEPEGAEAAEADESAAQA